MDIEAIYRALLPADINEFSACFTTMKKSAFRLELLDRYSVPEEVEPFKRYLRGEVVPSKYFNQEWVDIVKAAVSREVDFRRVRVAREPISDYLKFEVAWGYTLSMLAGEKVNIIMCETTPDFGFKVPILKDFWLFDEQRCYLIEYDVIGQFLGVNRLPDNLVKLYVELKKETIETSIDITNSIVWRYAA